MIIFFECGLRPPSRKGQCERSNRYFSNRSEAMVIKAGDHMERCDMKINTEMGEITCLLPCT